MSRRGAKDQPEPSKVDRKELTRVVEYVKENVSIKERSALDGRKLKYSSGRKIVEAIMASPFAADNGGYLKSEREAVAICSAMLQQEFWQRAEFVEKEIKLKDGSDKTKKFVRLRPRSEQVFLNADEPMVWNYEPTTIWTKILGGLLLLGLLLGCTMPMWPEPVRVGVSYISWCLMGLIGLFFLFLIVRGLVFSVVWMSSFGDVYFWVLPNINSETLPFRQLFWPLYSVKRAEPDAKKAKGKGKKGRKTSRQPSSSGNASTAAEPDSEEATPADPPADLADSEPSVDRVTGKEKTL